jgi:hypothetical protein
LSVSWNCEALEADACRGLGAEPAMHVVVAHVLARVRPKSPPLQPPSAAPISKQHESRE